VIEVSRRTKCDEVKEARDATKDFGKTADEVGRAVRRQIPILNQAHMAVQRLILALKMNPEVAILISLIQIGAITWHEIQSMAAEEAEYQERRQKALDRFGIGE